MPRPLLIFSQSDNLIRIIAMNSHTWWQTVQIQISWQHLDLHCLQRHGISGLSRTRVTTDEKKNTYFPKITEGIVDKGIPYMHLSGGTVSPRRVVQKVLSLIGFLVLSQVYFKMLRCTWIVCWIANDTRLFRANCFPADRVISNWNRCSHIHWTIYLLHWNMDQKIEIRSYIKCRISLNID